MALLRIFAALPLSDDVRRHLADVQQSLLLYTPCVKWEDPRKLHVTLKFIGDFDEIGLPQLVSSFRDAAVGIRSFSLQYRGLGVFPNARTPKVVWVGTDAEPVLTELQGRIERACAAHGVPEEKNAFHSHVTIGRVKGMRDVGRLIEGINSVTFEPISAVCSTFHLMKSILRPEGSQYSVVEAFPLFP